MYKKGTKLIAGMLVFMLAISNLSVIGREVYATSLEAQTKQTNNANVEFDAYFVNENKQTHSATKTIGEKNNLYVAVNVKTAGYLKNATIEAKDANFKIEETLKADKVSKVVDNKIYLNQIKSGNNVQIEIPIQILQSNSISVEDLNKENKLKLTGTYVDGKGKENKIEKDIIVNLAWTAAKEAELKMQVSKFVPYSINKQEGVMLQTIVQSYLKDNTLPVKENKIEISIPSINEIKPKEVKVVANTENANHSYNAETGILTITVKNEPNAENKISWNKNAQDEFVVTAIYEKAVAESIKEEPAKVIFNAKSELTMYDAEQTKAQKEFKGEVTLKEQISNLVDFTVEISTSKISKGQIYANYNTNKKIETNYQESITANVGLADVTEKIVVEQTADNFVVDEKTKAPANTYNKEISLEKLAFDKMLGEEGFVKLYSGETLLATIDNKTEANKEGKLIVNLAEFNINTLRIETSKPLTEGKITFNITKAIKGDAVYSIYQMKEFKNLELNVTGKAINGEVNFASQAVSNTIPFTEPTTQAELTINNSNLSTVVVNKDVKISAILKTDTLDCNLYKNPTLKVTLPSYVENINIKNIEVLFETEGTKLTLKDKKIITNSDGTKTILINLEGTQTEYTLGAVSKGVNVVITSDITVNKLTPNKQEQIKMSYTNSNVITRTRAAVEENEVSTPVNFVAPTGIVTTTSINGYKEGAEELTSISGEEKVATIDTMTGAKNITYNMNIINNYKNTIDNISILGRVPFKGNKNIATGKDLGSTIDMKLQSALTVNGVDASKVTIYYSENKEATKDVSLATNGWTLSPANFENVKSYLIVLKDYTMNASDAISFKYVAQVPANLQHNEEAYENYVVYFNNNLETGAIQDKALSPKLEINTGVSPILNASIKSNIAENVEILEGKLIKYTISVTNTGREEAKNVTAKLDIPSCLTQVELDNTSSLGYRPIYNDNNEEIVVPIANVPVNETVNTDVYFLVNRLSVNDICKDEAHYIEDEILGEIHSDEFTHSYEDFKCQINISANITADKVLQEVSAKSNNNIVKKSFYVSQAIYRAEDTEYAKEGEDVKYIVDITCSDSGEERENTVVSIKIPEELSYKQAKVTKFVPGEGDKDQEAEINFNKKTNELTIKMGNVDSYYGKRIEVICNVNKLNINEYEKDITLQASIKGDNTPLETTEKTIGKVAKYALNVKQVASITENSNISAGEDFKYTITLENPTPIAINGIKVKDVLPKELEYCYSIIKYSEGFETTSTTVDNNGNPEITLDLEPKSNVKIEVYVIVKEMAKDTKITNNVTVEQEQLGTINVNAISHTIENFEGIVEEPEEAKKRIVGTAWKDENKNGIMDVNEPKMSNVEVMLFNNATGDLVTDEQGNRIKITTTNDGTYTFDNIEQGTYTVIFLYDTANYSATKYKVEDAEEEVNSNALDTKITLDGEKRLAAITEVIEVNSTNIYNINLGLVENAKFDLKLDKTVSKITVQDSTGTNVYDYKDSKLAKKDLVGKEINDTTIIVEYKITVSNEGAVPGYVKKIVDYMPTEMKFNSELNRDWYSSENGAIYNSSLANTLINPGESKEVTLMLTKKLTEDNIGLYHNTAEIYEAYNDLGLQDVDSTEANKITEEDDTSTADVLITVKTGETILFVGLSLSIITIIGTGAYFIKKKVLR